MRHNYDIMIIYMEKYKEKKIKKGQRKNNESKHKLISNENLLMATASLLSI